MDIPINVEVKCADGPGGRTESIILNPINMEVTHIVVRNNSEEYLVPLALMMESSPNGVQLRCTLCRNPFY